MDDLDILDNDILMHHGILGQKWGVRRFQNFDGSLKNLGSFKRKFQNTYIDAMDTLNRKGALDFLDSKADTPFKAKRSVDNYISSSRKDPLKAMENTERYLDMAAWASKGEAWMRRQREQKAFSKAMDYITDPSNGTNYADGKKWADAIIKRTGQSAEDKKLGMISKEARDIERESTAKAFVEDLKKSNWDVTKLTDRWYKTDPFEAQKPAFSGRPFEVVKEKVADEYEAVQVGPGEYKMKVKSWKTIDVAGGPTKEFIDFQKSNSMPSDYSHVTDGYVSDFIKSVDSMTQSYESILHDDIVGDFLAHHGTKGQKWGSRKYQNSDGSLTPLGRLHYGVGAARNAAGSAAGKVGSAAGKVGSAIKKKVNPSQQDLEDKYQKAVAKRNKKELKAAIKEAQGKKKKNKDLTDQEMIDKYNRLQRQKAIEEMERENSTAHKIGKGLKVAARGTAKGVAVTAKGAAWTAKLAGKMASPLLGLGGELAMRGLRNAGQNWVDNLTMSDSARAQKSANMSKNLLDAAKNAYELDRINSGKYKRDEDARRESSYSKDRLDAARNAMERDKARVDHERVKSGEYRTSQFLKDQAEAAKNQATIAKSLKEAFSANDKPKKSVADFVKEQQLRRDGAKAELERRAIKGDTSSLAWLDRVNKASKGKDKGSD